MFLAFVFWHTMISHIVFLVVFIACVSTAHAQITISLATQQPWYAVDEVRHVDTAWPSRVNIGDTGTSAQTWDFSTFSYRRATPRVILDPAATLYGGHFAGATTAVEMVLFDPNATGQIAMAYFKLAPNGLLLLGRENDSLKLHFPTPVTIQQFPLTLGTTWSSHSTSDQFTYVYQGIPVPISVVWDEVATVDAWGTMTTRTGTHSCLRVRTSRIIAGKSFFPLPVPPDTTTEYQFVSDDGENVHITFGAGTQRGSVRPYNVAYEYFTPPGSGVRQYPVIAEEISLHPSPASSMATFSYSLPVPTAVTIELVDMLGRVVCTVARGVQASGRYSIPIDASPLAPGAYIIRLSSLGGAQERPIMVAR
jgi:hypothetical protein